MNQKKQTPPPRLSRTPIRLFTSKNGEASKILHREKCRILDVCGSCSLLNEDYKDQLIIKSNRLKEKTKEHGFSAVSLQQFCPSEERVAYRQSVKLVVSEHLVNGKPWIDIGFFRQSLNKIVDIGNCPIQSTPLNETAHYLRSAIRNFNIPVYSPRRKSGVVSGLILRSSRSTRQTFVTFLVRDIKPVLFRELACDLIEKFSFIQGVFLQLDSSDSSADPVLVAGRPVLEEQFGLLNYKVAHNVELPIHPTMTAQIYARVLELCDLNRTDRLFHVFSGLGALSCLLAPHAKHVVALDEKKAYAQNIEMNLPVLGLKNVQVVEGKLSSSLAKLKAAQSTCDVAVVTVPRAGIKDDVLAALAEFGPRHMVLVSSFHDEFFESLKTLKKQGYQALMIEPFDTHPGTPYFEVLCYLKK
jgi:23S rRNA (uracil1939-C5)-methyltransferase